jgi:hypothetical protein
MNNNIDGEEQSRDAMAMHLQGAWGALITIEQRCKERDWRSLTEWADRLRVEADMLAQEAKRKQKVTEVTDDQEG